MFKFCPALNNFLSGGTNKEIEGAGTRQTVRRQPLHSFSG